MKNEGLFKERIEHNPREKAFAEVWEDENTNCAFIDYGYGTLQNLFVEQSHKSPPYLPDKFHSKITKRDRFVVATVIQWLGTNVGMGFLHKALNQCGYKIVPMEN